MMQDRKTSARELAATICAMVAQYRDTALADRCDVRRSDNTAAGAAGEHFVTATAS